MMTKLLGKDMAGDEERGSQIELDVLKSGGEKETFGDRIAFSPLIIIFS